MHFLAVAIDRHLKRALDALDCWPDCAVRSVWAGDERHDDLAAGTPLCANDACDFCGVVTELLELFVVYTWDLQTQTSLTLAVFARYLQSFAITQRVRCFHLETHPLFGGWELFDNTIIATYMQVVDSQIGTRV